jgi:predicted restriction endonuclease
MTPRSQGGGNELTNLIVLCRNHHADADAGSLSRSVLRELIRGDRFQDEGVKEYWAKSAAS